MKDQAKVSLKWMRKKDRFDERKMMVVDMCWKMDGYIFMVEFPFF